MLRKSMVDTIVTKLKLALLENAVDFLRKAVEELHPDSSCGCDPFECKNHTMPKPDPAAAKYALMHAYAGVVLILKERLRRADPELLKDPKKHNPDATVTYHKLIARLGEVGYALPGPAATMLDAVRDLRNPFEHFEVEVEKDDGERMVAEMVEFAYNFLADELDVRLEEHVSYWVWMHVQDLHTVALRIEGEEAAEHAAWWKSMLGKYTNLTDEELEKLADLEPYHPRHNPDAEEFHHCPHCFEWTVVRTEDRGVAVCTNKDCREPFNTSGCKRCGELLLDRQDFCENCEDDLFGDDA